MDAAHSFRIHLKGYMTPKKGPKGKTETSTIEKPTLGTVWLAKTYPLWQNTVLTTMKNLYLVSNCFELRLTSIRQCVSIYIFMTLYFPEKSQ